MENGIKINFEVDEKVYRTRTFYAVIFFVVSENTPKDEMDEAEKARSAVTKSFKEGCFTDYLRIAPDGEMRWSLPKNIVACDQDGGLIGDSVTAQGIAYHPSYEQYGEANIDIEKVRIAR